MINIPESVGPFTLSFDPHTIAAQQRALGAEWAQLYAAGLSHADRAEIGLRNPLLYLEDGNPSQLPPDLQVRWTELLELGEAVYGTVATDRTRWASGVTGLARLRSCIANNRIKPELRGAVAHVLQTASELFADSVVIVPGDTAFFAGNIVGMASWIRAPRAADQAQVA